MQDLLGHRSGPAPPATRASPEATYDPLFDLPADAFVALRDADPQVVSLEYTLDEDRTGMSVARDQVTQKGRAIGPRSSTRSGSRRFAYILRNSVPDVGSGVYVMALLPRARRARGA